MKNFNEILTDQRILKVYKNVETEQVSKLKMEVRSIKQSDKALVSLTRIEDWEHLSVSFKNKIPSWECMEEMKRLCFYDDEECFQMHPKVDNYVNNNEYTLHIWKPVEGMKQIPPSILVGFRENHIEEDKQACLDLHARLGMSLTNEELEIFEASMTPGGAEKVLEKYKNDPFTLMKVGARMGIL